MALFQNLQSVIKLIRMGGPVAQEILDCIAIPDWTDRDATQAWAIQVVEVGQAAAKLTPTNADDVVAATVRRALEDSFIWNAIYGEAMSDGELTLSSDWQDRIMAISEDSPKVSPIAVMEIIGAIITLIRLWREGK